MLIKPTLEEAEKYKASGHCWTLAFAVSVSMFCLRTEYKKGKHYACDYR